MAVVGAHAPTSPPLLFFALFLLAFTNGDCFTHGWLYSLPDWLLTVVWVLWTDQSAYRPGIWELPVPWQCTAPSSFTSVLFPAPRCTDMKDGLPRFCFGTYSLRSVLTLTIPGAQRLNYPPPLSLIIIFFFFFYFSLPGSALFTSSFASCPLGYLLWCGCCDWVALPLSRGGRSYLYLSTV